MRRAAALILILGGFARAEEAPLHEPDESAPRNTILRWTSPQKRPFEYRLPETIDSGRPPNLLVMTYGTGMGYQWAFLNYPVTRGWRSEDIIVAPEAVNPMKGFFQAKPDETEVLDLLKLFRKRFPVGNVYLYGHSQGAFFTYWFGGQHPDLVDGIVGHAGRPLNFKFPKKAAQNQAVGILHGFSDQVVPVWCAYNADRRYRERGYEKVRLWVVEGLHEQAGHWPLPYHVNEMLDWVDRMSIQSLPWAVHLAARELGKKTPDLAAVAVAVAKGRELSRKHKGEDADTLNARLEVLQAFMEKVQAAHAKALAPAIEANAKKPEYGSWAVHFRIADEAFRDLPSWQEATKPLKKHLGKHAKAMAKVQKSLLQRRSSSTMADCLDGMREAFLAPGYEHFLVHLRGFLEKPDEGDKRPDEKERKAYDELEFQRETARRDGKRASEEIDARLIEELRAAHPDWVPKPPDPSGG